MTTRCYGPDRCDQANVGLAIKQVVGQVHAKCGSRQAGAEASDCGRNRGATTEWRCAWNSIGSQGRQNTCIHAIRHLRARIWPIRHRTRIHFKAVLKNKNSLVAAAKIFRAAKAKARAFHDAAGDGVDSALAQAGDAVVTAIDQAVKGHGALRHNGCGGQQPHGCRSNQSQFFHEESKGF